MLCSLLVDIFSFLAIDISLTLLDIFFFLFEGSMATEDIKPVVSGLVLAPMQYPRTRVCLSEPNKLFAPVLLDILASRMNNLRKGGESGEIQGEKKIK